VEIFFDEIPGKPERGVDGIRQPDPGRSGNLAGMDMKNITAIPNGVICQPKVKQRL
jgi:hypothetical protein